MNDFKNLQVWQRSIDLAATVHEITKGFPSDEKFGLTSQIRRCSVSISSNISEGAGRASKKDFSHFLSIALGSCYELETQLVLASRFGYILNEDLVKALNERITEIQKMINGLRKSLLV